jgi:Glycosyltransferase family 87
MNGSLVGARIRTREETLRGAELPLRTLFWAWSVGLAIAIASASAWSIRHGGGDWRVFVAAGSLAGTPALLDPPEAWQSFFYLPGAAWALTPFAHMPLAASFVLNAILMLACAAAAGVVAARTHGLRLAEAAAMFALWPPVMYAAAITGQNAPLGVLLAQLAIAGVAARSAVLAAVPVGLLLYKPTYALPFIVLLIVRRRMRELAIVAAMAVAWYVASVAASGGNWLWPAPWVRLIAHFAAGDFTVNAPFAISLPGVLAHAGASPAAVIGAVVLVLAGCAVALRRVGAVEAASASCLAGLALSPHAWAYDAALALPMIAYVAARLEDRARVRLLLALWLLAPLFFVSPLIGFDPLAIVTIGGTAAWLALRLAGPAIALSLPISDR